MMAATNKSRFLDWVEKNKELKQMDDEETEILIPPGNETDGGATRSNMHPTW